MKKLLAAIAVAATLVAAPVRAESISTATVVYYSYGGAIGALARSMMISSGLTADEAAEVLESCAPTFEEAYNWAMSMNPADADALSLLVGASIVEACT